MKNGSELNGCTKTLTFEKPLCSRASPDGPEAAWKALKVKLHRRALVGRFGSFLDLIRVWVGVRFRCPEVGLGFRVFCVLRSVGGGSDLEFVSCALRGVVSGVQRSDYDSGFSVSGSPWASSESDPLIL